MGQFTLVGRICGLSSSLVDDVWVGPNNHDPRPPVLFSLPEFGILPSAIFLAASTGHSMITSAINAMITGMAAIARTRLFCWVSPVSAMFAGSGMGWLAR